MALTLPTPEEIPTQEALTLCGATGDNTYPRETARVYLTEEGKVSVQIEWIGTSQEGVPFSIWHHRTFRFPLPENTDRDALVEALAPEGALATLLERLHQGHTVVWDGNNYVGRTTQDASDAEYEIDKICPEFPTCSELTAWQAGDWLVGSSSYELALEYCDLKIDSTPEEIVAASKTCIESARRDGVLIRGGEEAVHNVLMEAIEHEKERIADQAETHAM